MRTNLPQDSPIKFEIVPTNQSYQFFVTYEDDKVNYYEIDVNNSIRIFEALSNKIPTKQLENSSDDDKANFKCPYEIKDDFGGYQMVKIESPSFTPNYLIDVHLYCINKSPLEVTFNIYPSFNECKVIPLI